MLKKLFIFLVLASPAWAQVDTETNTPTDTATATATKTTTNTATATATRTPSNTRTNTATQTATSTATSTATVTATDTITNTPTVTATNTPKNTWTTAPTPGIGTLQKVADHIQKTPGTWVPQDNTFLVGNWPPTSTPTPTPTGTLTPILPYPVNVQNWPSTPTPIPTRINFGPFNIVNGTPVPFCAAVAGKLHDVYYNINNRAQTAADAGYINTGSYQDGDFNFGPAQGFENHFFPDTEGNVGTTFTGHDSTDIVLSGFIIERPIGSRPYTVVIVGPFLSEDATPIPISTPVPGMLHDFIMTFNNAAVTAAPGGEFNTGAQNYLGNPQINPGLGIDSIFLPDSLGNEGTTFTGNANTKIRFSGIMIEHAQ